MKAPLIFALIAHILTTGCKTQHTNSNLHEAKSQADTDQGNFNVENLKNSEWASTFDGGRLEIKINMNFSSDGQGRLVSSSVEEEREGVFTKVRMATEQELQKAFELFGSNTFEDSTGTKILIRDALVLIDGTDDIVHILPVLHANELLVYPLGSIIRK